MAGKAGGGGAPVSGWGTGDRACDGRATRRFRSSAMERRRDLRCRSTWIAAAFAVMLAVFAVIAAVSAAMAVVYAVVFAAMAVVYAMVFAVMTVAYAVVFAVMAAVFAAIMAASCVNAAAAQGGVPAGTTNGCGAT